MNAAKSHYLTHMRWYSDCKRAERGISKLNSVIVERIYYCKLLSVYYAKINFYLAFCDKGQK